MSVIPFFKCMKVICYNLESLNGYESYLSLYSEDDLQKPEEILQVAQTR